MFPRLLFLSTLWLLPLLSLAAQCSTLEEIRTVLARATVAPQAYAERLREDCPTAADSLSQAFYSRSLYHNGLGDRRSAIVYGELALREFERLDTSLQFGKINYNLGLFNLWDDNLRESLYYMRRAAAIFPRVNHQESEYRWLQALDDIGLLLIRLGDYERAEEQLLQLKQEARKRNYPARVALASRRLGDLYEQMGRNLAAAAGELDVAVAGAETPSLRARARISRVSLNHERGNYAAARRELMELLRVTDDLNEYDLARLYSLAILLALEGKDVALAEDYFSRNLEMARALGTPTTIAQAYDNGGEAALAAQNYPRAVERFTAAVGTLVPGFSVSEETIVPNPEQISQTPQLVDLVNALNDLARAYDAAGQPDNALAALRAADLTTDRLRAGLGGEVSALFWRGEALPIYERAIQLCLDLGRPLEETFYFFEKSRAILLLEALAENDLRGRLPRPAARRLAAAERKLRAAQRALMEDGEDDKDAEQSPDLPTARQELLDLRAALADSFPNAFPDANPEIIDLDEAMANLRAGGFGRQLQYFVGAENTYLLSLNAASDGELSRLGPTDSVLAVVRPLLAYFTDAGAIDQDPQGYDRAAALAFTTLLAPATPPENEPLLVVPDGLLSYVPFAGLRTDGRYLIERNPVAYAQSATLFGRATTPPSTAALAFTPFAEAGNAAAAALPHTAAEAAALADHYPTTRLTGPAATRAILSDSIPYGILHLGTHAQANRTADSAPRILTATEPLFVPDIYGLDLRGALVTLSACNSNVGPLARGEGVLGLGRAFRAAGAGGVVASLWSLNDRATADITGRFYAELAGGKPKPLALHAAQLDYLRRADLPGYLKSPYYWAGLTYYGDAGTMKAKTNVWGWPLGGILLLALLAVVVRRMV